MSSTQLGFDFDKLEKRVQPQGRSMDSVEKPEEKHVEPTILSVSDLNKAVRGQLERNFPLVWVKGEISNFKAHSSGHFYFSLKDAKSQVNAIMFRGFNQGLRFRPQDGMEVIVRGKITVYEPRGTYQVFCELMEPVGAGALQLAFEQLKKKLEAEGLFEVTRKRPLPVLPRHVAVVTSPTGAAIRDVINVLSRRYRGLRVTLVPALVQGEGAAKSIVAAIELAQKLSDVDVMIVGRGGGSAEDLWCFNDEAVARAIFSARVPVISAVGHEIDFTIADFVADLRAPTPSAAAELVVKSATELLDKVTSMQQAMARSQMQALRYLRERVRGLEKSLVDPKRRLLDLSVRCDELSQRLEAAALRRIEVGRRHIELLTSRLGSPLEGLARRRHELRLHESQLQGEMRRRLEGFNARWSTYMAQLEALSPLKVVERGFAIVQKQGVVVKSHVQLVPKDQIEILLAQGTVISEVVSTQEGRKAWNLRKS